MAHLVYPVVYGGIFLNIGIRGRHVGFGLVIVVITDKILNSVMRKKRHELIVELRRQGLVVGDDQGSLLRRLDNIRDSKGLAGAGNPEECLMFQSVLNTLHKSFYRPGLIPFRFES